MFLEELTPIIKELTQQPVAFMSGFVTGLLKLNLNDEPLKSWLEKQGINGVETENRPSSSNGSGPQSISID